jgi:hypothetical protein
MNTLLYYYHDKNIDVAKAYLKMNNITRATIARGSLGEKWAIWLGRDIAEGGGGWPTPYRTRWAAKHDAIMVCRWLGLPLYNEKASGTIVEVTL